MEKAIKNDVPGIDAECGGACACATCHVYVDEAGSPTTGGPSAMEEDMLDFASKCSRTAGSRARSRYATSSTAWSCACRRGRTDRRYGATSSTARQRGIVRALTAGFEGSLPSVACTPASRSRRLTTRRETLANALCGATARYFSNASRPDDDRFAGIVSVGNGGSGEAVRRAKQGARPGKTCRPPESIAGCPAANKLCPSRPNGSRLHECELACRYPRRHRASAAPAPSEEKRSRHKSRAMGSRERWPKRRIASISRSSRQTFIVAPRSAARRFSRV